MSLTLPETQRLPMWIGGDPVMAASGELFQVIDPGTEELVAEVPRASAADAVRALEAAAKAQHDWKRTPGVERCTVLHGIAAKLREHKEKLAELITREMGRPLLETLDEVEWCAMIFDHYAELGRGDTGRSVSPGQRGQVNYVVKEPFGVVVAITPWNYPLLLMTWKAAPALAAGNTVVVKPSELSPLSSLCVAEILSDVVPAGCFNVVTGFGAEIGAALVEHPLTNVITFTGSTATGKRIAVAAAASLKTVHLELGGSDPIIICDDVDLDVAARAVCWSSFLNNGQVCTSAKRILVFVRVYDKFVEKLVPRVQARRLGHGLGPDVDLGPIVSSTQRDQVERQLERALAQGAKVLAGGKRPDGKPKGWFFEPTLVADSPRDGVLLTEEVFGPVRPVVKVKDLDDAIAVANGTPYGLGASIFTTSLERAMYASEEIRSGTFWINDPLTDNHAAPFGGCKESGLGRELGPEGLDAFRETKHVHLNYKVEQKGYWFPYNWDTGRNKPS